MNKYHVIVSNSDGEIISHLNQSLVGMLNIALAGWINTVTDKDISDEDILFSLKEYWDSQPVMCTEPDDHIYQVFISSGGLVSHYDLNRLFETKKALLKWARTQIKKKVSEE